MLLGNGASTGRSIKNTIAEYKKRRFDRAIARLDAKEDEGRWVTTEEGHHVHFNENGEPDKGNPHVIKTMKSGTMSKAELGKRKFQRSAKRIKDSINAFSSASKEENSAKSALIDTETELRQARNRKRFFDLDMKAINESSVADKTADEIEDMAQTIAEKNRDKAESMSPEEARKVQGEINQLRYLAEIKRGIEDGKDYGKELRDAEKKHADAQDRYNRAKKETKSCRAKMNQELSRRSIDRMKFLDDGERRAIIDDVSRSRFMRDSTEEIRNKCMESLKNASDAQLSILKNTINKASVGETDGTSHYMEGTGLIRINSADNRGEQTMWHEYGHYLDDSEVSGMVGYDGRWSSDLSDCLDDENIAHGKDACDDLTELMRKTGRGKFKFVPAEERGGSKGGYMQLVYADSGEEVPFAEQFGVLSGLTSGAISKEKYRKLEEYKESIGYPDEVNYSDYFESYVTPKRKIVREKERFKGAKEAYTKAVIEKNDKQMKVIEEHPDYYDRISELYADADAIEKEGGAVSDIVCAMLHGRGMHVYGSHSQDYYSRGKFSEMEMVANYHEMRMNGSKHGLRLLEMLAPRTAKNMRAAYDRWLWRNISA